MDLTVTPTELALRRRIAELELKVELLEREYSLKTFSYEPSEKVTLRSLDLPPTLQIRKTAQLSANLTPDGGIQVRVEGRAEEGAFTVAYYIGRTARMSKTRTLDLMAEMHLQLLPELAKFVDKETP